MHCPNSQPVLRNWKRWGLTSYWRCFGPNRITVRQMTGYSQFHLMCSQNAVLPIEPENLTWNTTNWTQGIDDTPSQIVARAWQLEWWRGDIDATIPNLKVSSDAKNHYFDLAASLWAEHLQIGDLAPVHKTKIGQAHGTKLDAKWRGPCRVTETAWSLGYYRLAERDGAELVGWIDGSLL